MREALPFCVDVLVLEVCAQAAGAVLAAVAAGLVPSERAVEADRGPVDGDGAGADAASDRQRLLGAGGPDPARQAVLGVVGDPDGVINVVVGNDGEYRPEDLLLRDAHAG